MAQRIEDYALIGNTHTACLVGRNGSIDWMCVPRFDSAACLAALLGSRDNGCWQMAPATRVRSVRRAYRDHSLVLETEFETDEGRIALIDFMSAHEGGSCTDLVRIVEGRAGTSTVRMDAVFRFDYGRIVPWVSRHAGGLHAIAGPDALLLHTPVETQDHDDGITAEFRVRAGERVPFVLTHYPSHEAPPRCGDPHEMLERTHAWWRDWASRCTYRGPWANAVVRSAITLKALTYRPTGGIVAAPTTSLPERPGGVRNWDYRYCWVRDSTFTLLALLSAGYDREARDWREWLLRAVAGRPEQLQIMYGIAGERRLDERELPWLEGYERSRPVRIGNGAHLQLQLDVLGEVMDTFQMARRSALKPHDDAWRLQCWLLDFVEANWQLPDRGIWEVRGDPRHFVHSKVMAWVAVDRALKAHEMFGLDGPVARWRDLRDRIHAEVCERGFDRRHNSFVQFYGADRLDAALLLIPQVGFLPFDDPRVVGTIEAVERDLVEDGLVHRYRPSGNVEGIPGDEGAFLACSFWLCDALAGIGRVEDARRLFDRLLALRNDVGLLSEEYGTGTRRQLGNFPQAFTHVALINTAMNLTDRHGPIAERRHG